ncbi:CLUMA_CG021199, isoform A [Clunio marinus]|uniref:CLUMA_CG021199, isoform A n=1 Tax=Clunio marinus TaxID=568069 RepID=A0A1J1J875_9DIPT|nr:CLUMA_CG021199, isoform A [Clunio marinus]
MEIQTQLFFQEYVTRNAFTLNECYIYTDFIVLKCDDLTLTTKYSVLRSHECLDSGLDRLVQIC